MKLPPEIWMGWVPTAVLAKEFGYSRRHMLRLLKSWKSESLVHHMKAFEPDDYRLFDIWIIDPIALHQKIKEITDNELEESKKAD